MNEVTQILSAIEAGEPQAADRLLPLVYEELRKLAAAKLAQEKPGQTLDATALVHEAYLRLVGPAERGPQRWDCRGHFFAAAAEAMRRILVENARRKARARHGGSVERVDVEIDEIGLAVQAPDDDVLAVHESLDALPDRPQAPRSLHFSRPVVRGNSHAVGHLRTDRLPHLVLCPAWLYKRLARNLPKIRCRGITSGYPAVVGRGCRRTDRVIEVPVMANMRWTQIAFGRAAEIDFSRAGRISADACGQDSPTLR
jgi:RNA polymerase sigma factor (TIGR02999 family)